jgi:hypothetical protein
VERRSRSSRRLAATLRPVPTAGFRLPDLPSGSRVLIVRVVGLDASILPVDLSARTSRTVNVSMRRPPPTLATVNVTAERAELDEAYRRLGFTERQRIGIGRFITEDQIRTHGALTTGDVLTQIQGIKVGDNGDHGVDAEAIDGRASRFDPTTNACTLYVLDGQFVGQDDYARRLPPPTQVIGIEIYRAGEPAPVAPPAGTSGCAMVIVWTRAMLSQK